MKVFFVGMFLFLGFMVEAYGTGDVSVLDKETQAPSVVVKKATKFDFEETMIEGDKKSPTGFYLRGRQPQTMKQMVKLRADFMNKLRSSRAKVDALAK